MPLGPHHVGLVVERPEGAEKRTRRTQTNASGVVILYMSAVPPWMVLRAHRPQ